MRQDWQRGNKSDVTGNTAHLFRCWLWTCWLQLLWKIPRFYRDPGLSSLSGVEECPALDVPFRKKGIVAGCGAAEHLCHTVEPLCQAEDSSSKCTISHCVTTSMLFSNFSFNLYRCSLICFALVRKDMTLSKGLPRWPGTRIQCNRRTQERPQEALGESRRAAGWLWFHIVQAETSNRAHPRANECTQ